MKTEKSILAAFFTNLFFTIFEFLGGIISGSIAISSDAIHDLGDSITIGVAYILERKSHEGTDEKHTYGYNRYSTLGALVTTTILVAGSIFIISESIEHLLSGEEYEIKSDLMLIFSAVGMVANLIAVFFTHKRQNANERAINLHMIEDVLGNLIILIGAIIIKTTNLQIIDPIMSIIVAAVIMVAAIKNMRPISTVFLEKTPDNISINKLKAEILKNKDISDVHHLHFWNIDEEHIYATLHIVTKDAIAAKKSVREVFERHKINHVTIETETAEETCLDHEHKI